MPLESSLRVIRGVLVVNAHTHSHMYVVRKGPITRLHFNSRPLVLQSGFCLAAGRHHIRPVCE